MLGRFLIPAGHPSLPGHFPGRPVVPGVVLLDHVLALAGPVACVEAAKFVEPVLPGQWVEVAAEPAADRVRFVCRVADRTVLRGTLRPAVR